MADANLAQDGRAFSNAGEQVEDFQTFWNVDDRTAIVIMRSESLVEPADGEPGRFLYASFFDGTSFTPPVQIRGVTDDRSAAFQGIRVLFLNARGRKGDAIITFVRQDRDVTTSLTDPLLFNRNPNQRLWGTYFDRSSSTKSAVGTVRHGFETRATAIDFDNVVDDAEDDDDDNDPSVRNVAFVSDSLHGTHDFLEDLEDKVEMRSGDPTTQVHIVFAKDQSEGTTVREVRWQSVAFDLTQDGNAMPQQASATAGTLLGPNGDLDPSDTLDIDRALGEDGPRTAWVHDNHFFWGMREFGEDGEDQIAMDSVFGPNGNVTPLSIGSTLIEGADSTVIKSAELVFGPDHGLDSVYVLAEEFGFSLGESGSRSADIDLVAVQIAVDGSTQEAVEIDAFTTPLDLTDGDGDGLIVGPGAFVEESGTQYPFAPSMRITGDGSYIAILFTQPNRTLADLDDGNAEVGNAGRPMELPYAQIIQTSLNGKARPLAESVLASPLKAPAVENDEPDSLTERGEGVKDIQFQIELGESDASGATYQSNVNRMFFSYMQETRLPPLDPNDPMSAPRRLDMLFVNSFEVTLGARGIAPTLELGEPTIDGARVPLPESTLPGASFLGAVESGTVIVDRADARDGYLALFFSMLDIDLGTPDVRVFASDGTNTFLVSSPGSLLERSVSLRPDHKLEVRTVGSNSGTRVHVLWREVITGTESTTELCTRSFEKRRNVFAPELDEPPVALDNVTENEIENDEDDEGDVEIFADGTTLGVYFREGGHIFYEETTGDATRFHEQLGLRDPQLVDDDSLEVVVDMQTFAPPMVDDLRSVMTVFQRNVVFQSSASEQSTRAYIRVHD